MISDHASGSSCSASSIEPFTSANTTVTCCARLRGRTWTAGSSRRDAAECTRAARAKGASVRRPSRCTRGRTSRRAAARSRGRGSARRRRRRTRDRGSRDRTSRRSCQSGNFTWPSATRPTTSIEAAVGTSLRHTDGELPDVNGRCAPPSGLEPAAWIAIESRPALA